MRIILGLGIAVSLVILLFLGNFYSQMKLDISPIVDYKPKLTTQFFDRNGELIANVFDEKNRRYASFDEIPTRLVEALVAVEDTAFFEHDGINIEAIFRAAIKDIQAMALVEGASTITQQLVKNLVLTREKKFVRKLKEVLLAYEVEKVLSKEQIIERYLNEVFFGHGYYGVKTAAAGYFRKPLSALSLKEMAILVGLPKAPSTYDPTRQYELSMSRANAVIGRMRDLGWIDAAQYQQAINEQPKVYNDTLTQNKAPYLIDEALKQLSATIPDIKSGGYKITLTADLRVQKIAENALKDGYNEILKRNKNADENVLNGAAIVSNPLTGEILALVGGVDYAKSSYNRATQSSRQPGSSFKPFVYLVALNQGFSPASKVADVAMAFEGMGNGGKAWKPKNYGGDFAGFITLKDALKKSRNLATISLLVDVGFNSVHSKLDGFGFRNIPPNLSIALGSFGISPMDYSEAYSLFAGMGNIAKPYLISDITAADGSSSHFAPNIREVVPARQAYLIVDMMKAVVNEGTGRRASVPGLEIAGKTGTTNNNIDAWFCGFSPELEVIVWYGNDDNTPMRKVEGGGLTSAPVFSQIVSEYKKLYPDTKSTFDIPSGVKSSGGVLYTDISPLPQKARHDTVEIQENEGLIF